MASLAKVKCLVTGGCGFLGQHLVQQLLENGRYEVSIFDVRASEVAPSVRMIVGDLRSHSQVDAAVQGQEIVFHCAAACPTNAAASNQALMIAVNVEGTRNVIAACQRLGVPRLVYTSSASVVFEGRNLFGADERLPYASRPMDFYTGTKIQAERLVLAANGQQGLRTVALRPSGIFGENDPLFVPVVISNARKGKMRYIIGNGRNLMDFTYVGNVAYSHILAADSLAASSITSGRAYFITNAEPRPFWGFLGDFLEPLGYQRPSLKLPWLLIFIVAAIVEFVVQPIKRLFNPRSPPSDFTRSRITLATTNRVFKCDAAREELGYVPKWTLAEGQQALVKSFQHLHARHAPGSKGILRKKNK